MANLNELLNINTPENWNEILDRRLRVPRDSGAFILLNAYNQARRRQETPLRRAFHSYLTNERVPNAGLPPIPMGLTRNDFINELINDFFNLFQPAFIGKRSRKSASRKTTSRKSTSRKSASRKPVSRKSSSRKSTSRKARSSRKVNIRSKKGVESRILPKEKLEKAENSFCNSLGEDECKRLSQRKTFPCRWVPAKGKRKAYCGIAVKAATMGEGYNKKK